MKILYVSEAVLPSDSANSISILNMCMGLAESNQVTLLCYKGDEIGDIYEYYGVDKKREMHIIRIKKNRNLLKNKIKMLVIATLLAFKNDLIYTRWVQAADVLGCMKKKCILELHSLLPEKKNKLVKKTLRRKNIIKIVFINENLKKEYERRFFSSERFVVEPGAAVYVKDIDREFKYECGYIGSFYEGKGIEVVCELAKKMSDIRFHVVGGKPEQIQRLKEKYGDGDNVIWYGYQPYNKAMKLIDSFGIALLPNQARVVVGNTDIGQFTSPNKLFEYMSHGKIIIASRVIALQDVLTDKENAIMVSPTHINEWEMAIRNVKSDSAIREVLVKNEREQVKTIYNWNSRAARIIGSLQNN